MLDPSLTETSGTQILSSETNKSVHDKGHAISSPRPPGNGQAVYMRNTTVKQLIMLRNCGRQSLQNWSSPQKKTLEHGFQYMNIVRGTTAKEPGHESTAIHINTNHDHQSLENGHINPQHSGIQHPTPKRHPPQSVDGKMSFFHWQIRHEASSLERFNPEILKVQDVDGDTVLHIAVAQGRRALAYVLAWKMARVGSLDLKEHNGQTALQIAVATNHHLIVQDLLLHGAQINTADCWGRSPLHVCAERGYIRTLQSIQRTGSCTPSDVEVLNYDGLTPLHTAVVCHNAIVKDLRCLTAELNERRRRQEECIETTVLNERRKRQGECINTLLLMGACCGTKDLKSGRTSLHMAAEGANFELLRLFLDQPSSLSVVNVTTFNGNTALHFVSALPSHIAQVDGVRLLMRRGADPSTKNIENELPAHLVPEGPVGNKVRQVLKGRDVHV